MSYRPPVYNLKIQQNILSQNVLFIKTPESDNYLPQLDISFGSSNIFEFDLSDPTLSSYTFKFVSSRTFGENNIDKIMARNISSEMHSGFANLRKNLSMNFLGKKLKFKNNKETSVEITRTKKNY